MLDQLVYLVQLLQLVNIMIITIVSSDVYLINIFFDLERGHKVTLFERDLRIGGQFNLAKVYFIDLNY